MTTAKQVVQDKLWIIENDGSKLASLQKFENKFILTGINGSKVLKKRELIIEFGTNFFQDDEPIETFTIPAPKKKECYGFPTCCIPYNEIFDVRRKIACFTKCSDSKNLFVAGYFFIKFVKGWVKSFCPKESTLAQYEFKGPWKTEGEIRLREYDDVPY